MLEVLNGKWNRDSAKNILLSLRKINIAIDKDQ